MPPSDQPVKPTEDMNRYANTLQEIKRQITEIEKELNGLKELLQKTFQELHRILRLLQTQDK